MHVCANFLLLKALRVKAKFSILTDAWFYSKQ